MKNGILCLAMLLFFTSNAYGMEPDTRISIQRENMENGFSSSLGINTGGIFYGGASLNYITSSTVIQYNNRKTIYPVYLVIGLRAPWKISPYGEVGLDLPEAIFDEIFNSGNYGIDQTDYYFSGGVELLVTENFSFSLYAKQYQFIFRENNLAPISRASPGGYGAGIMFHF